MLDSDLAELYQVETKRLNENVKRNHNRFPTDFMFQLTDGELENLKSQFATSSLIGDDIGWGGRRKLPYVFSEHGVLMLSSVLNSKRAITVNIQIMRIFTKLREMLLTNKEILLKLEQIEKKVLSHDEEIKVIFDYLKQLLSTPKSSRIPIGYKMRSKK